MHKSNSSAFLFHLPPSLSWCLSPTKIFHSRTLNSENFPQIFTITALYSLYCLGLVALHLASSSCRNFSTRSLNRKNSKRTYWNWWVLIIHAQGRFLWKPRKLQPPEAKVTHHCLVEILYFSQREGGVNDLTHRPSKQMYRASLYTPTYKAPTKNLIFSGSN